MRKLEKKMIGFTQKQILDECMRAAECDDSVAIDNLAYYIHNRFGLNTTQRAEILEYIADLIRNFHARIDYITDGVNKTITSKEQINNAIVIGVHSLYASKNYADLDIDRLLFYIPYYIKRKNG